MTEDLKNAAPASFWIVRYDPDVAETIMIYREMGYFVKYSRGLTEVRDIQLETFFMMKDFIRV